MDRDFGGLIRRRRERLGVSVNRLSELIGRAPATVRSWERGRSVPNDPEVIRSLAAVLGVDEREMLDLAGVAPPPPRLETPTLEESLAEIAPTERRSSGGATVGEAQEPAFTSARTAGAPASLPVTVGEVDEAPGDQGRRDLLSRLGDVYAAADRALRARRARRAAARTTVVYPVGGAPVRVPSSYLEDPDQRLTYRMRAVYTAVALVVTFVVLVWAARHAFEALGNTWDAILGGL